MTRDTDTQVGDDDRRGRRRDRPAPPADEEFGRRLLEEFEAEATAYRESGSVAELADVLEVVDAIRRYESSSDTTLLDVRPASTEECGRRDDQLVLEVVGP